MSSVCSNCGKSGHFFRECSEPITSLGIIAFRRLPSGTQWLLVRRRDSLGFIEIMRGKYELRDEACIQALIDQTSMTERERLMTKEFTDLWRELWNGPASRRYLNEFEQAKAKFDVLRAAEGSGRRSLASYCSTSTTTWAEPEWGFPKGRRSSNETELACALRETFEEAGLKRQELSIMPGDPLMEEFRGSNGIQYRHRYWLAEVAKETAVVMDPSNIDQRREIGDLRWFSLGDAIAIIRPYNAEKRVVLQLAAEREASA